MSGCLEGLSPAKGLPGLGHSLGAEERGVCIHCEAAIPRTSLLAWDVRPGNPLSSPGWEADGHGLVRLGDGWESCVTWGSCRAPSLPIPLSLVGSPTGTASRWALGNVPCRWFALPAAPGEPLGAPWSLQIRASAAVWCAQFKTHRRAERSPHATRQQR